MKNLVLVLLFLCSFVSFSQNETKPKIRVNRHFKINNLVPFSDSVNVNKLSYYTSISLSVSNTKQYGDSISKAIYPSGEFGGTYGPLGVGLAFGRGDLFNFRNDNIRNYWYEVKTSFNQPIGPVNVYGLFGVGNYMSTRHLFIEYGVGMSVTIKKYGIFVQSSNWDGIDYISTGVTYNF